MISPLTGARLAQQAYAPDFAGLGLLPDLSPFGCTNVLPIFGSSYGETVPYAFLATMPDGGQVIAIRGTDNFNDAMTDGNIHMVPCAQGCPGLVHRGFWALAGSLGVGPERAPILPHIVNLSNLAIVAHSLGAPLGRFLTVLFGHVGQVMTWGEPRSCDGAAAGYIASSCATTSRRAVNPHDPVPMVPNFDPCDLSDGYRHIGEPFKLPAMHFFLEAHALATYIELETALSVTP